VGASRPFDAARGQDPVEIEAGGFQIAGGLRIYF
jgi:hypothetical protein